MVETNGNIDDTNVTQPTENQRARAQLRERFLRLISQLSNGQECRLKFCENSEHMCKVRAFNPNFENVVVENLITNYPEPIRRAIVRTSDLMSMHFEIDNL